MSTSSQVRRLKKELEDTEKKSQEQRKVSQNLVFFWWREAVVNFKLNLFFKNIKIMVWY